MARIRIFFTQVRTHFVKAKLLDKQTHIRRQ